MLSRFQLALANDREVRPARRGLVTAPAESIQLIVTGERQEKKQSPLAMSSSA